jgi:hypothetical protein
MHQFWPKMGWATFWAIFFTNPSGHPDVKEVSVATKKTTDKT